MGYFLDPGTAVVLRQVFGRLAALRLDIEVDRLVVRALRVGAPGPGRGLLQAGRDAELAPGDTLRRAATAFLAFSACNLCDDLSDGDCDYLPAGHAQAVLLILNSLFFSALRDLGLRPELEGEVLADLVATGEAQVIELGTTRWDAERLRIVTDGIAGRQWSAYLRVMWAGTSLEHLAPDVARHVGRVALLAGDIRGGDPRYAGLSPVDRRVILREALLSARALDAFGLSFPRQVVARDGRTLVAQLATEPGGGSTGDGEDPLSMAGR